MPALAVFPQALCAVAGAVKVLGFAGNVARLTVAEGNGFDASANAAKQKSNTKVTTHTGTIVVGLDAVAITSGKDTHISGSKVIGKSVTANVGGNLSIESLQDTKTYVGESSNKGFSVSTNSGSLSNVSMSSIKGKMESCWKITRCSYS